MGHNLDYFSHSGSSEILFKQCSPFRDLSGCGNGIRTSSIVSDGKYLAPIENAEALAEICFCLSRWSVTASRPAQEERLAPYLLITARTSLSSIVLLPAWVEAAARSPPSCSKNLSLASRTALNESLLRHAVFFPIERANAVEILLTMPFGRLEYGVPCRDLFKTLGALVFAFTLNAVF